jgi:hypothetical protein
LRLGAAVRYYGPAILVNRSGHVRLTWLFAVTLLVIGSSTLRADDDECLGCHGDRVASEAFEASAHGTLGCGACHTDITEYPHPEKPAPPDCGSCHAEVVGMLGRSVHAAVAGGDAPAACAACHGDPHRAARHTDAPSPVHWTSLASACARCHADSTRAGSGLPLARPVEA